jgi:hypothetical protein
MELGYEGAYVTTKEKILFFIKGANYMTFARDSRFELLLHLAIETGPELGDICLIWNSHSGGCASFSFGRYLAYNAEF